jgi:hypothetical protein
MMGIFDRIGVQSLPAMHPLFYLAFELELFPAELGRPFKLAIRLADADGGKVLETEADAKIEGQAKPGDMVRSPQVIAFAGLPFRKAGRYSVDIFLNGDRKSGATFEVIAGATQADVSPPDLPK